MLDIGQRQTTRRSPSIGLQRTETCPEAVSDPRTGEDGAKTFDQSAAAVPRELLALVQPLRASAVTFDRILPAIQLLTIPSVRIDVYTLLSSRLDHTMRLSTATARILYTLPSFWIRLACQVRIASLSRTNHAVFA